MERRPQSHRAPENKTGRVVERESLKRYIGKPIYDLTNLDLTNYVRLNRYLAAAGVGSRRKCDELIADGRVTINGRVCTNFSAQPSDRDHVKVGSKMIH